MRNKVLSFKYGSLMTGKSTSIRVPFLYVVHCTLVSVTLRLPFLTITLDYYAILVLNDKL